MHKKLTIILAVALVALTPTRSHAGDKEWAVVGKVLTGITAAAIVGHALSEPPVYQAQPVIYVAGKKPVHIAAPYKLDSPRPVLTAAKVIVRERPRFRRQRTVIVDRTPVFARPQRGYGRERSGRSRHTISVAPSVCPTRY